MQCPDCLSTGFFSISHCLSVVGLWPSSSLSTGCVVPLRGDWAIFYHAGSGRVGRVWSAREKSLEILRHGWELNPGRRKDRQWAIPLSYHDICITISQTLANRIVGRLCGLLHIRCVTTVRCYDSSETRQDKRCAMISLCQVADYVLVTAFAWFWLAKTIRIIGRFWLIVKELKSYRLALTDGLPMNNSIGKP